MKHIVALCLFAVAYAANPDCQLKPETGPCRALIPQYYYDPETRQCRNFFYGGCDGNGNRFETQIKCLEACAAEEADVGTAVCHLVPEPGLCEAYMPRYYYDVKTAKCQQFIYGGCGGNANNFRTVEECEAVCRSPRAPVVPICEQEVKSGPCFAYFPRYYYNKETGQCAEFIYGGCKGNENNFMTREDCEKTCQVESAQSTCELEAETGPCRGAFTRFYFNKDSGKCETFLYGGCKGNANNFRTEEECQQTCSVQSVQSVCEQEPLPGPCRASFPRYYFNKETGKCENFIYGGCQGNDNNFRTVEECQQTCGGAVEYAEATCQENADPGRCDGYFPRYYYDKEAQECRRFTFGGCGGNDNNFESEEDCLTTCGPGSRDF